MEWSVEITQSGRLLPQENQEVVLKRLPFTIKITLSQVLPSIPVKLNVLDNDSNLLSIHPGVSVSPLEDKDNSFHCFNPGKTMAENILIKDEELVVTDDANHAIYSDQPTIELPISRIYIKETQRSVPVQEFQANRLFLLLLWKFHKPPEIQSDEVRKIALCFQ